MSYIYIYRYTYVYLLAAFAKNIQWLSLSHVFRSSRTQLRDKCKAEHLKVWGRDSCISIKKIYFRTPAYTTPPMSAGWNKQRKHEMQQRCGGVGDHSWDEAALDATSSWEGGNEGLLQGDLILYRFFMLHCKYIYIMHLFHASLRRTASSNSAVRRSGTREINWSCRNGHLFHTLCFWRYFPQIYIYTGLISIERFGPYIYIHILQSSVWGNSSDGPNSCQIGRPWEELLQLLQVWHIRQRQRHRSLSSLLYWILFRHVH